MENKDYELLYDLHTHTTYSHGQGSVEDNAREAMAKGLRYVAISDHGSGHLLYGINRRDVPNLKRDVEKMNVKFPHLQVKMSVEANVVRGGSGLDVLPEEFGEYDFVIAGFHFGLFGCGSVRNWLWVHGIRWGEEKLRKKNTQMVVHALEANDIAILTHPGDKGPFDIRLLAETCARTNTLMEINCRHGHLTEEEIRVAAGVPDVRFILSSDAHTPEAVGQCDEGLERAIRAGLDPARIVNIMKKGGQP